MRIRTLWIHGFSVRRHLRHECQSIHARRSVVRREEHITLSPEEREEFEHEEDEEELAAIKGSVLEK